MKSLLFLCHRLPYPPDKGDKIRSFNILEALCSRYRVHLGTFVDAEEDWAHVETLRSRVASLCVRPLPRRKAMLRSLAGLATGEALTLPYYRDAALRSWVRDVVGTSDLSGALVYSSGMGQYLADHRLPVKIMDFCDLDSDKWAQYAQSRRGPWRWIYAREARLLAKTERDLAASYDYSLFVSELESALFRSLHPAVAGKVVTLGNGVNTTYFDPSQAAPANESAGPQVVFTGAMDYWANVDAVSWFARDIWPAILERFPTARFFVVGSNPTPEVQLLADLPAVTVTGRVPDVRPWLQAAAVVVAPLRIARGVQNKVLEAMAMARPVVATGAALQGLGEVDTTGVQSADSVQDFAAAVCSQLARAVAAGEAQDNRSFVLRRFSWPAALAPLWPLLETAA